MPHRPTLAEFVDQELRLSEATFGTIVDAVLKQWHERPTRRADAIEAMRVVHGERGAFIQHAVQSLHDQALGKVDRATAKPAALGGRLELSLVDDEEVTLDIEVARIVERSNSELEEPLRELRTYTSALVGDVNTARDTNPLRPEVWVRALLAAARGLPIGRNVQTDLLRCAAQPLIRALHECYGAACSRLHALGVIPAVHRTVVNEGVVTELTDAMRARRSLERGPVRDPFGDSMWHSTLQPVGSADYAGRSSAGHAGSELHTAEYLSRLYDAILADRRLPSESQPLLSRLYPTVLHQALLDDELLADAAHPVWRFIDQLGFLMQTRTVGDHQANLAFVQGLVEQLATQHSNDSRPFQSAANRLIVHERQRFARAVAVAAPDIALLTTRLQESNTGSGATLPQSLDPGGVDIQRPPLRRDGDADPEPDAVVEAWRAGSWVSIFLRAQWRRVLVLWRAPPPGPLLLLDAHEARHWAVPSASIELLAAAGLARVFAPRSLISDAVGRIGLRSRGRTLSE
ncbi:MAG TPA: DUF1631 family protein [Burkholderiaceae bacterium]|nr:DUF1631 family protein [Burkholderiaceae bacterium]